MKELEQLKKDSEVFKCVQIFKDFLRRQNGPIMHRFMSMVSRSVLKLWGYILLT